MGDQNEPVTIGTIPEAAVANWLNARGYLMGSLLAVIAIILILAFVIGIILYVASYQMENESLLYPNDFAGDGGCGDDCALVGLLV